MEHGCQQETAIRHGPTPQGGNRRGYAYPLPGQGNAPALGRGLQTGGGVLARGEDDGLIGTLTSGCLRKLDADLDNLQLFHINYNLDLTNYFDNLCTLLSIFTLHRGYKMDTILIVSRFFFELQVTDG